MRIFTICTLYQVLPGRLTTFIQDFGW